MRTKCVERLVLVGGASLAIIGSCQKVTTAGTGEAGMLQVVSETILEVTRACAGQGVDMWRMVHVTWSGARHGTCAGTGRTDV